MAVAKFNTEAMEQCRTTVSSQAGKFGAIGDGFSGHYGNSDIFGKLSASGSMAGSVSSMDEAAGQEFAAAEKLLGKVERTLDTVQSSVADIEESNVQSFRAV
ncbi:hypothetical protein Lesp02_54640 [Lentzea sp. NBRC 105346]|uniref:hypothetical protein n=1 Tax=Lentzea sp. NBRC 105346 TaxID=3032205 RepID=UPI0024A23875|nr:hypothetical protein [Lentzea sp. NBRC 105346]GLZ33276.1 hypothetical protein Lesp02_54640 [Lentzea sp. NBRC 105346]